MPAEADSAPLDPKRVIQLAGDLVDERGVDALTLSAIADQAGVTQPALYRHVDNAADVWRLLGLATRAELAQVLTDATVGLSGNDAVHGAATAWRTYALAHPGRYRSTDRYPVTGDDQLEVAVERVLGVLRSCLRGFDLSAEHLDHGAVMLRSALHGFVSFELGDGNPSALRSADTFDRLIDMLCHGLHY